MTETNLFGNEIDPHFIRRGKIGDKAEDRDKVVGENVLKPRSVNPVKFMPPQFIQIAVANGFTYALDSDGDVWKFSGKEWEIYPRRKPK